jgi:asparagine synthetase A
MTSKTIQRINSANKLARESTKYYGRLKSSIKNLNDFGVALKIIDNDLKDIHTSKPVDRWDKHKVIIGAQKKLNILQNVLISRFLLQKMDS